MDVTGKAYAGRRLPLTADMQQLDFDGSKGYRQLGLRFCKKRL